MSHFHTKSQKRVSKMKMLRNDKVMKFVSEQLKTYDADLPRGQPVDFTAREAFAKLVLTRAQVTIPGGPAQVRG